MKTTACLVAALAIALAAPPHARADETRAKELFQQAEVHFNLQEFEKALDLYKQAYKLRPLPGFLFNIGQCQRYLGQYEEALFSYRIYLLRVPGAPNKPQVETLIKETEKLVARQKAGENPDPPKPPEKPDPPPDDPDPPPDRPDPPDDNPHSFDKRGPRALPVWVGVSVTAALVAGGVVTGQMAHNRAEEYADPDTSIPRRQDLKDAGESLRTASIVTFSLAGVSAVATTVYYLLVYRPAKRAWRDKRDVFLVPSAGGLTLTGEF